MRSFFMLLTMIICFFSSTLTLSGNNVNITLPMALSIGLDRNIGLMKKRLEIKYKKMASKETYRAFLPQIGLSFNRAVTIREHDQDTRQYRYEISLDQLIFDGGKVKNAYKLSKADTKIATKILQAEERAVRLQILTSFSKVIGGRKTIRIYKEFLSSAEKELKLADLGTRLGTTTIIDRDEIATRHESAKLELLKSREDYYLAKVAFHKLLRIPLNKKINLLGELDDGFKIMQLSINEKKLFEYAKMMRLDFAQSTLQYQRAIFEYKSIKRSWLPDVSLSSKFFLSGPSYKPTEKGYSLFLNFSFPFFGSPATGKSSYAGGDDKTLSSTYSFSPFQDIAYIRKLAQTKSASYFASLEKSELPETVRREIRLAVKELELTRRRFEIRDKQISILKKRIKILGLKVKLGESKHLDLAKARIEMYKAILGRMEHIIQYINTSFKLETTVGLMPGRLVLFKSSVFSFGK